MNHELHIPPALLEAAQELAEREGIDLDQFVRRAITERLSIGTEAFFAERAKRADLQKALAALDRAGVGRPPVPGDEID